MRNSIASKFFPKFHQTPPTPPESTKESKKTKKGGLRRHSECPSPEAMEQLIFDLYLCSPTKERRQRQAVKIHYQKQRNAILSPTEMELNTEQLILDIYLESPSKKIRQVKAMQAWEKAQEEKRRNTVFSFTCIGRQMTCGFQVNSPAILRGQFGGTNLVAEGTRKRSATM